MLADFSTVLGLLLEKSSAIDLSDAPVVDFIVETIAFELAGFSESDVRVSTFGILILLSFNFELIDLVASEIVDFTVSAALDVNELTSSGWPDFGTFDSGVEPSSNPKALNNPE